MKVNGDTIRWIVRFRGNGFSQEEIGDILGLSQQVVGYQLAKLKIKFKTGRHKALFEEDDQQ